VHRMKHRDTLGERSAVQYVEQSLEEMMVCLGGDPAGLCGPSCTAAWRGKERDTAMREVAGCLQDMRDGVGALRGGIDRATAVLEQSLEGGGDREWGEARDQRAAAAVCLDCLAENLPVFEQIVGMMCDACDACVRTGDGGQEATMEATMEAMVAVARVLHVERAHDGVLLP
jgi:hypothetical protein